MDGHMENDRQHLRYPISATALIRIKDKGEISPLETVLAIANISKSGLGLYSYSPLSEGSSVSMDITFKSPGGFTRSDAVEGRVIWSSEFGKIGQKGGLYFIGISFDRELSPEGQPFLYEYLRTMAGENLR
jgi:hypothetical protein